MVKNSFTLVETLISITLLAIVISGFLNSSYYDEQNQKYWDKWFSRNQTEILTAENKEILNEMYLGGGIMSKYRMNFFLEDGDEEFIEEEAVYED